jgi:AmiR/NasT family two-component response regulator
VVGLERALESNREIGVAMGIMMAAGRYTQAEAFEQLVDASQHLNRRVRDIASEVALTGAMPSVPGRARRTKTD